MDGGQHAEAIPLLQESIAATPHFKSLELLGECFVKLGRLNEAVVPLAAATTLNKGVRAPALLAEVFLRLGDYHDARTLAGVALARSATKQDGSGRPEGTGRTTLWRIKRGHGVPGD